MPKLAATNWILIAAIFTAGLFAAAQFGKLTLTLEVMQNTYADAQDWVPSLISIVGIVGLIFGVVAAPLVARFGLSRALLVSLLVGAAMSFVQATLPPIEIFAMSRVIEGFSHLGMVIAAPTLIAAASTDADRPIAIGIWAAFFGASLAITAYFLPAVLAMGGLPLMFGLHGGGMLAIASILTKLLPDTPPEKVETSGFISSYRRLYKTPELLIAGAGFVWYTAIYIALIAVLPLALGLSAADVTIIPLVSIAGTLGAGVVAKVLAPHHLISAGFIASAILMVIVWVGFDAPVVIYLLFFLMGAIPTGAFAAIAHFNASSNARARATGGITHLGNVGTTMGTPLMVLAYQGAGLTGITVMVVICCAGGVLSIAALSHKTS